MRWIFLPLLALFATSAVATAPPATSAEVPVPILQPVVVARFPHDPAAFTEGLIWDGGALVESVGLEGRSDVRRVDLATGKVRTRVVIPAAQFGEGLAVWKGTLVSLTWHDGVAHRWNAHTLKPIGTAHYEGEGWGLASVPQGFVRSDGSSTLTFHDPVTMKVRRRLAVTLNGRPMTQINELEWVNGALLANVWHQPFILNIDPTTGNVKAVIDLRAIVDEVGATNREAVPNGIAWDPKARRLFVTGKLWPTMFEIKVPGL